MPLEAPKEGEHQGWLLAIGMALPSGAAPWAHHRYHRWAQAPPLQLPCPRCDCSQASIHIPFLLDGRATREFRGRQYMDGSLYDFLFGEPGFPLSLRRHAPQ